MLGVPGTADAAAPGDLQITEWAYNGIEFFELTNVGRGAADLAGWSYSDSARAVGAVDLSAFGRVAPGESVLVSELSAPDFRTAWGLPGTVKVIGGNAANLGRSDEINIYDDTDTLVDRLTYNDQGTDPNKGPRTDTSSAWVVAPALGKNAASAWTKSTAADAEASWQSTTVPGFYGSPGVSTLGGYDAAYNGSATGSMRITEWAYNGIEFFELTNVGSGPQDLAGWSYSDSARTPGALDLSAYGAVAPGESVVFSELPAAGFRTAFGLDSSVKVIGGNTSANLGRSDEINIYDDTDALVDRLTYNDQGTDPNKGPRTDTSSAWVVAPALGKNAASSWTKSTSADAEGSWESTTVAGFFASPGVSNFGFEHDTAPPQESVRINEVESNGDVVADWVELTNPGASVVDVSGWQLRDGGASNPSVTIPGGTTIAPGGYYAIYTEIPGPGFGLGVDDEVTLFKADGTTVVDSYAWGPHAATTYGRCPDGSGEFRVTTVGTRGGPNACSPIRVNEVLTSSAPDKVEIVNISDAAVDISGWVLKDSTDTNPTTLPAASVVPAHGYLVIEPIATLDAADSVRLYDGASALVDSATWATDPTPSLGRCADGVGAFKRTKTATIGSVNDCPGLATEPWPGSPTVTVSDDAATFNQDASGLAFDPADATTLWVAQNKLGTLWKMKKSGGTWAPSTGWSKTPKYHNGTGAPDSEGITVGPDGAVYLATERDNSTSGVSKNAVLRYDADAAEGGTLNATDEWDLNPLLPSLGANLGLEGITWVPDSFLVDGGFVDERTSTAYAPSAYPDHGTGLYVVAVEGTGLLYVLALDQTAAVQETAHLVATVDPRLLTKAGPPGVMDVSYDAEQQRLWAICDDSCDGTSVLLELSAGKFVVEHAYERPAGMPNLNNEGFALAPQSSCVAGKREVVWADDGDTDGHSLRSGTFPCDQVAATVAASNASVAYGKAVAVPVEVTADGSTPTGSVSVSAGETVLGTATLVAGHASVSVPAKSLEPGTHPLTVAYAGDDHVATGTDSIELTVTKALGSVSAADVSVVYGAAASVPVTVNADGVTPTGSVSVRDGAAVLGTATLATGQASVAVLAGTLQPGVHALTVEYAGDEHVTTATKGITLTVAKVGGTVSATGGSVVYGKSTSIPVIVTGGAPTGSVTVSSGSTVLGTATLTGGAATVAIPAKSLAPGAHPLTVAYAGDGTVAAGTTTATLTVTKTNATIAKPTVAPKQVIVKKTRASVTIKVTAWGVTPTGKVTVAGGGLPKQTVTLRGGKAVVKLPAFRSKGTKKLTVTYLGDTFVQGASAKATVQVKARKR